jgi:hypothetical protein
MFLLKNSRAGAMAQVVECLASKHKALDSNSGNHQNKENSKHEF